jgi:hypothetical protein
LWEALYNPNFNSIEFDRIDREAGRNGFILTPTRWIESVNAIGCVSKQGRYAETLAHKDIAFKFASWLSVKFELYLIKEFQRLKTEEQQQIAWTAKRDLAKVNYPIHTDAIKENLIVPTLTQAQKGYVYADEAELLNVAIFGITSKEWRAEHSEGAKRGENIHDYASVQQLLVLSNMESYNSIMIKDGLSSSKRLERLNEMARQQLQVLLQVDNRLLLPKSDKK